MILPDEVKEELKARFNQINSSLSEHVDDIINEVTEGVELNTPEMDYEASRYVGRLMLKWFVEILKQDEEGACGDNHGGRESEGKSEPVGAEQAKS